jgi:hypothetical protein
MADRIAVQIKSMIGRFPLAKGKPRAAAPGDFMVLVRKRRELAGLIVARLHAAGVPVERWCDQAPVVFVSDRIFHGDVRDDVSAHIMLAGLP